MRVLVLGGTEFVGRAIVGEALAREWQVTAVNRGTHPAAPGVSTIIADRRQGFDVPGEWDLVVDTWSEEPRPVLDAASALADRVGAYSYVSTRSVYDEPRAGADESWPTVEGDPAETTDDDYARSKRGAELAVLQAFGARSTITRPGCIFGPWENTGRLPWWLGRMSRGGDVLAPGPAAASIQYVDARDLAAFALDAVPGVFNTVATTTMGALLDEIRSVTGSRARLVWSAPQAIIDAGIEPWRELPAWLPPGEAHDGLHGADTTAAEAAGLVARPLADTVRDTWEWMRSNEAVSKRRIGLDPAKEAAFLASR
ncbi:SDR family oxidoreductase [soil metagenome]